MLKLFLFLFDLFGVAGLTVALINKWCICGDLTFNKWQIVWLMNGIHGYLMMF